MNEELVTGYKQIKSGFHRWSGVYGRPPRSCQIEESEYIIENTVKTGSSTGKIYTGCVIRNLKIDEGVDYIEVYRMTKEEAEFWERDKDAKEAPRSISSEYGTTYKCLVNAMLALGRTNIKSEIYTPKKGR